MHYFNLFFLSFLFLFTVSFKVVNQSNHFMILFSFNVPDVPDVPGAIHGSSDLLQTRIAFPLWDAPPDYPNPYREWRCERPLTTSIFIFVDSHIIFFLL